MYHLDKPFPSPANREFKTPSTHQVAIEPSKPLDTALRMKFAENDPVIARTVRLGPIPPTAEQVSDDKAPAAITP